MRDDSVVREIRQIKDDNAAKYGYDVRALGKALQEDQRQSGRKLVSRCQKRVKATVSAPKDIRVGRQP
jgi:hypothetical protein